MSAESGAGLAKLLSDIIAAVERHHGAPDPEMPLLTRERHRRALEEARDELTGFGAVWADGAIPPTVAAVHLRAAVHALEAVVGAVDVEDVLDRVFGRFCVGK